MIWEIAIPCRNRSDNLAAIADDVREVISDPEEAAVTRAVALELALEPGIRTIGDALDAIDGADPESRRGLLDRARERAGYLSTERAEQRAVFEAAYGVPGPPEPLRLTYGPRGQIIDLAERERDGERARRQAESRQRRHEAELAARRVEAEQLERVREAEREQLRREHPEGIAP